MRGRERHKEWIDNVVDEVEESSEEEAEVTAEADEPLLWLQASQTCLKGEYVEQNG